jgi:antitoxin HigA-1
MQKQNIRRAIRPSHPGAILRGMLEELGSEENRSSLSQTNLARRLGVSRRIVNELVNERRSITADMAIRLSRVFGTTPDIWMNLQKAVDLWDATKTNKGEYSRLRPIAA